jgi:hypothetical protein
VCFAFLSPVLYNKLSLLFTVTKPFLILTVKCCPAIFSVISMFFVEYNNSSTKSIISVMFDSLNLNGEILDSLINYFLNSFILVIIYLYIN